MVGSIERLRRHIRVRRMAPVMLLAIGVPGTDPIAKRVGTAGVITIPASAVPVGAHGEVVPADGHRDAREDRGRILYAPGHAPRDTATVAARPMRKQVCAEQEPARGRSRGSAPTS